MKNRLPRWLRSKEETQETQVPPLGHEDPPEESMATLSSSLA